MEVEVASLARRARIGKRLPRISRCPSRPILFDFQPLLRSLHFITTHYLEFPRHCQSITLLHRLSAHLPISPVLQVNQTVIQPPCSPLLCCLPSWCSALPPRKTPPAPSMQLPSTRPREVSASSLSQIYSHSNGGPPGQWCNAQKNTCGTLCGGRSYTKNNNCDPVSLSNPFPINMPQPIIKPLNPQLHPPISRIQLTKSTRQP